ncbi:uncharacterized protein LOC135830951 isoform X1 [Sycon ciliatum]|uniref:uncharacterized protein LOC135830951 isoform X1 n=1 Tax=Sycon ciliatum TaxID=27933 RepID=UPI0031F630E5
MAHRAAAASGAQPVFNNSGIQANVLAQGVGISVNVTSPTRDDDAFSRRDLSQPAATAHSARRTSTSTGLDCPTCEQPSSPTRPYQEERKATQAQQTADPAPTSEAWQCSQQQLQTSAARHNPYGGYLNRQDVPMPMTVDGSNGMDTHYPGASVQRMSSNSSQHSHTPYPVQVASSRDSLQDRVHIPPEGTSVDPEPGRRRVLICYCPPAVPELGCVTCAERCPDDNDGYAATADQQWVELLHEKVLNLADALRDAGVDVRLDQYEMDTDTVGDWADWLEQEFRQCDYVLAVCNKHLFPATACSSAGSAAGHLPDHKCSSLQTKYLSSAASRRISRTGRPTVVPLLLDNEPDTSIPLILHGGSRYVLHYPLDTSETGREFTRLLARLTGQNRRPPPPVGPARQLPNLPLEDD